MPTPAQIIQTALLVLLTVFHIGQWVANRERGEKDGVEDAADVKEDFDKYCTEHKGLHDEIWREIERIRKRYHEGIVPWQQETAERLATITEHLRSIDAQLKDLWIARDRRREPR